MPAGRPPRGRRAQLGVWAAGPATRRWWWSMAVRATVLVGLGLELDLAGAQVVIVLVHLGCWSSIAAAARAPAPGRGGGRRGRQLRRRSDHRDRPLRLGRRPYRLLPPGASTPRSASCWSQLWLRGGAGSPAYFRCAVGCGLLVLAAAMLAAEQLGRLDLVPYSGTAQETVLDTAAGGGGPRCRPGGCRVLRRSRPAAGIVALRRSRRDDAALLRRRPARTASGASRRGSPVLDRLDRRPHPVLQMAGGDAEACGPDGVRPIWSVGGTLSGMVRQT